PGWLKKTVYGSYEVFGGHAYTSDGWFALKASVTRDGASLIMSPSIFMWSDGTDETTDGADEGTGAPSTSDQSPNAPEASPPIAPAAPAQTAAPSHGRDNMAAPAQVPAEVAIAVTASPFRTFPINDTHDRNDDWVLN